MAKLLFWGMVGLIGLVLYIIGSRASRDDNVPVFAAEPEQIEDEPVEEEPVPEMTPEEKLEKIRALFAALKDEGGVINVQSKNYESEVEKKAPRSYAEKVVDAYLKEIGLSTELAKHRESLVDVFHIYHLNNGDVTSFNPGNLNLEDDGSHPVKTALENEKTVQLFNFGLKYPPIPQLLLLFPNMTTLKMSDTGLGDAFDDMNILNTLTHLTLTRNEMTRLPNIPDLKRLTVLALSGNNFAGEISFENFSFPKLAVLFIEKSPNITEIKGLHSAMRRLEMLFLDIEHEDKLQTWLTGFSKTRLKVFLMKPTGIFHFKHGW